MITDFHKLSPDISAMRVLRGRWHQHPSYRGCVGHWLFNEGGGGTAYDASRYQSHGTIDGPSWGMSPFGRALSFDGVDDIVDVGSPKNLMNLTTFTYMAWCNPSDWGENSQGKLLSKTGGVKEVSLNNSGSVARAWFFVGRGTTDTFLESSNSSISLTEGWFHLCGTYDENDTGKNKLYKNGVEMSYSNQTLGSGTTTDDGTGLLGIGNRGAKNRTFDGLVAFPKVFNRALTPSEVLMNYRQPFLAFASAAQMLNRRYFSLPGGAGPGPSSIYTLALMGIGR